MKRAYSLAAAALLAAQLMLVWSAMSRKAETVDEGLFIADGVAQVRLADPNFDLSHPPLLRWVSGLSAVVLGGARALPQPVPLVPRGAMNLYYYKLQDAFDWGVHLFYDVGNDHDRLLFWGRFPFALFATLTGWLLFIEVRRRFGERPAFLALAAFAFTPELLAHAEWAHSDCASTMSLLVVALALARALESRRRWDDLLFGLALALAIAVKLTGVLLLPFLCGALVVAEWRAGGRLRAVSARLAIVLGAVYVVTVISYLPEPRLFGHEFLPSDLAAVAGGAADGRRVTALAALLDLLPLPDTFLKGLVYTWALGKHGQIAYFHGELRTSGWWYYFPVGLVLKYPTPLLVAALAGLVALFRSSLSRGRKLAWVLPPLVIFGFAMMQSINIGVRSILTLSPFLALWVGAAAAAAGRWATRSILAALVALSALSGAAAYPNFLSYFNPLFGGNAAADRWLIDSNLDWGQDLPELARVVRERNIQQLRLAYFGWARPDHWGLHPLDADTVEPGWYAISRSYFSGIWPNKYEWLRRLQPVEIVGGSIALYHVGASDVAAVPPNEDAQMKAALTARFERHDPATAARIFRELLARNPDHYGANYQLAAALEDAGQRADALTAWQHFLPMAERIHDRENADYARARIAALGR